MYDLSISQFGCQLVNQQRQINDWVFRLFASSKYLITLRSIISPCQTVTTIALIPLYNTSFHLWKASKRCLDTVVFLSGMPFKICDCDKVHLATPATQLRSSAVTWANKPTFYSSLYKITDQGSQKNVNDFREFC